MNLNILSNIYEMIEAILEGDWYNIFLYNYVQAMIQNIMFYHGLTLYYMNDCFRKLNEVLQSGRVAPPFEKIYFTMGLFLEKVNNIFGPYILWALLSLLLTNAIYFNAIILILITIPKALYTKISFLIMVLFLCTDMYLYYHICESMCQTMRETNKLLLEYSDNNENYVVERFIFGRLTQRSKINICRMFNLDLNSLFQLVTEIILAIILLTQLTFLMAA
ncbi:hypothetical protein FF38_08778 [Lucilia cuprina]|uniref:Uncharacterized protein n=1 Tax=Lucilia cuprina TaxID=7375 RepID=A0A0L0CQE6_LUCCU|nr:hypothetical protein FF38_08778 [Lucilia cuprina]